MKVLSLAAALIVLVPSLAWSHGGGLDKHGCHNDNSKGDYHCHQGSMKGKSFKSEDAMLAAHPGMKDMKAGDSAAKPEKKEKAEKKSDSGKKAAKADDKAKEGEAKDSKSKSSASK